MKLKIALALAVAVILIGGWYFISNKDSDDDNTTKPDFEVTEATFSQEGDLLVTIRNRGEGTSTQKLSIVVEGTTLVKTGPTGFDYSSEKIPGHLYDGEVKAPAAGVSETYSLTLPDTAFETGVHDVTVTVNSNNKISESNSANNSFTNIPTMPAIPHGGE